MFGGSTRRYAIAAAAVVSVVFGAAFAYFDVGRTRSVTGDFVTASPAVAVKSAGNGLLLIANYHVISILDTKTSTIRTLGISNPELAGKLIPTSFEVEPDRIFVANYLGNNILVIDRDVSKPEVRITAVFGDDGTKSPEGVASNDKMVGVANYDGNNVQFFSKADLSAKSTCRIPVPQAHGIAFVGNYAFATSLAERSIYKIDPDACKVVVKTGELGWGPNQYLWPASIIPWDKDHVAVSDGHKGSVSILSTEDLHQTAAFGENGPGESQFNMPYGVEVDGSSVYVTSTFGSSILRFDKKSFEFKQRWSWEGTWPEIKNASSYSLDKIGWKEYIDLSKTITLDGKCYYPGYAQLVSCTGEGNLSLPKVRGSYLYFVQTATVDGKLVIFSPQCPVAYVVTDGKWDSRKEIWIGVDRWLVDGKITGPEGDPRPVPAIN